MNAELIKALRWCQTHGCSKCVALLESGSCKYGGAIKIYEAAADALEAADKRIAELEEEHNKTVTAIFGEEQLWWENRCKELEAARMELTAKCGRLEAQLPKEAHWVAVENGHGVCSNCNRQDSIDNMATHCRYCGARIGGAE